MKAASNILVFVAIVMSCTSIPAFAAGTALGAPNLQCKNACFYFCKQKKPGTAAELKDCEDDCYTNGSQPSCNVPAYKAIIFPKYLILTLVYAPPGCTGSCQTQGQVVYEQGSSAGTTISVEKSFSTSESKSLTAQAGTDTNYVSFAKNTDWSVTKTSSSSETITKREGNTLTASSVAFR